jgi:hypothetical protein
MDYLPGKNTKIVAAGSPLAPAPYQGHELWFLL